MYLGQPGINYSVCGLFDKNKELKKYKNLNKHEIQDIFIKMN